MLVRSRGLREMKDARNYYLKDTLTERCLAKFAQAMTIETLYHAIVRAIGGEASLSEINPEGDRIRVLRENVLYGIRTVLLIQEGEKWFCPHYLSIEGYNEDGFFVFDPSVKIATPLKWGGNRFIKTEDLYLQWTANPFFGFFGPKSMRGIRMITINPPRF